MNAGKILEFRQFLWKTGAPREAFTHIGKVIRRSNETLNHYLTKALVTYLAEKRGYLVATEVQIRNYVYDVILYNPLSKDITAVEVFETHKVEEQKSSESPLTIMEIPAIKTECLKEGIKEIKQVI